MIEIITKRIFWNRAVKVMEHSHFYHTYDYHHISKNKSESPILISYREKDAVILLPLLVQEIHGTDLYDATSVYGYAGPLTKNLPDDFDNSSFARELKTALNAHRIISVFSRLNPYIPHQSLVLTGLGQITEMGKLVNIDLTLDIASQKKQYQSRLRTYINKCRTVYTIKNAETENEVREFIALYHKTMCRLQAKPHYFFSEPYFFEIYNSQRFKTDILLAVHNETEAIAGGAMFIGKNKIVQYHLSGVNEDYLALNPIKMLIDEMRLRATAQQYSYFNLGGGVGSKEDSLFYFKTGFSKDFRIFKLWKFIVDERAYNAMVTKKGQSNCGRNTKDCPDYFPCYRCTLQHN
ncbi:GNAT family N-acetyltransferase [Arenibacter sp. GZD96]|uniref:GNAT family N-acetyltransferase n=1 Tax=Aurantibrevibacter litoralis TaxID=3106030 RepID=UPI002AFDCEF9|nr:GNAT family N-acetyltransferase [Arenibacter sp. GZD-96]MEA1787677.1 GNAT family N-acetyltransferase [Arenibacter sp. GZD-96]